MKDIVYEICAQTLRNSPEASYKRLNPALRSTLDNCIAADLPFERSTFRRIYDELRGGWWFGGGGGSHVGEHFYTTACRCNHSAAQQSFEEFAGRPGCLWEQDSRTPERLYVGARFPWKGYYVTVTSLRSDSLVGCTYKDSRSHIEGLKVGATFGYNPEHVITASKRSGASTLLTVVPIKKTSGESDVARRFVITYEEIAKYRTECKARLKSMVERIANCDPEKDAKAITKSVNDAHFRHFELEEIQSAFTARKEWIQKQNVLETWRSGNGGAWLDFKGVALRVRGDLVECSNGNSVSRAAAARALPVLLANRSKSMTLDYPLDGHRITRIGEKGVTVGCTVVPWSEVELIKPKLKGEA